MTPDTSRNSNRRNFLAKMLTAPVLVLPHTSNGLHEDDAPRTASAMNRKTSLKLSLNAYSFNKQLLEGSISLDEVFAFCADQGLMAIDITGYYFKDYPEVPSDEVIYRIKRKAFALGLEICGTGVRNDFTHADPAIRKQNVQLVKNWIDVARKLGGQTLRIFSGTQRPDGYSRKQILDWMLNDIRECVEYGGAHGVVVALQNHDDFIKTAADTIEIMESIQSPWFGLMLDIGSFRTDPYEEIAQTIKYAVTWQVKEKVFIKGQEVEVDAQRLMDLIKRSDFRGYLPLETLGAGDPRQKVAALHKKFLSAL